MGLPMIIVVMATIFVNVGFSLYSTVTTLKSKCKKTPSKVENRSKVNSSSSMESSSLDLVPASTRIEIKTVSNASVTATKIIPKTVTKPAHRKAVPKPIINRVAR